ncbi:helix-turn-helix transcriptional regulator [Pararhizobium sp. LjRoot238]|uniref:helix-turn-helix transcriptional regulator n=1 Tax=Pararhizobium sp. LjRoot238 TaxID=3342293 RepID=UPI003ECCA376
MSDRAMADEPKRAPGVGHNSGDFKSLFDDDDRFLTERELDLLTGVSNTTRWRERKAGRFPQMIALSPGRKGNTLGQVREWRKQRQAGTRADTGNSETPGPGRPRKKAAAQPAT